MPKEAEPTVVAVVKPKEVEPTVATVVKSKPKEVGPAVPAIVEPLLSSSISAYGLDYEYKAINLFKREQHSPALLNPSISYNTTLKTTFGGETIWWHVPPVARATHGTYVGSSERKKSVDYALESIRNIREALSGLWESVMKSKDVCDSQKIAIETTVKA
ncbi:uncharacterized protein LOC112502777 [Cynara cardunculus var. scolymus]|uniref:uncharacterized protein LOC112502777 n=1 Tax=Cynara cardunculus var. scolymus TaxID=59895 RepID=UPI000D62383D|nr:uncharacterized protein LOC112502777 [Cynara cardunculus var. scolymus]